MCFNTYFAFSCAKGYSILFENNNCLVNAENIISNDDLGRHMGRNEQDGWDGHDSVAFSFELQIYLNVSKSERGTYSCDFEAGCPIWLDIGQVLFGIGRVNEGD